MNRCKSTIKTMMYTQLSFVGRAFWKENNEDRVKLLESSVLNCCIEMTKADLHKIGLEMRE